MLLQKLLCFDLLMAVFVYDLLLKLWRISSPFPRDRKCRIAYSTKKSLREMTATTILFGMRIFASDTRNHQ